jgi:rare lipoprotein A
MVRLSVLAKLSGVALSISVSTSAALADQCGKAAWIAPGGRTASGEPNSASALTAAHPTLPFGTKVKVVNLRNDRSVVVRVNDRGAFGRGRVIDVSRAAADELGFVKAGIARVRISVIDGDAALDNTCTGKNSAPQEVALRAQHAPQAAMAGGAQPPLPPLPANSDIGFAERFLLAFRQESWTEQEMRKAIEARLPAIDASTP